MPEITVDEIKTKFQQLQSETQKLKEEKAGYTAQLETLTSQYNEKLAELLKDTGTTTLEEAVAVCVSKKEELDKLKESLQASLDGFLSTVSTEETVDNSPIDVLAGLV